MRYSHLQTAQALHDEIIRRTKGLGGKVYLFFDEMQKVRDWEKCVNSFRISLDEIDMSQNGIKHRNIRDFL